jgi:hypothetical protein
MRADGRRGLFVAELVNGNVALIFATVHLPRLSQPRPGPQAAARSRNWHVGAVVAAPFGQGRNQGHYGRGIEIEEAVRERQRLTPTGAHSVNAPLISKGAAALVFSSIATSTS